jgi:hypothetical protein
MKTIVSPSDTGAALINPGMGFVLYYYDQHLGRYGARLEPHDTVEDFPGASVVYMAVPWAFLEPAEGRFNWPLLDTPAQRWIARGKQIALRFPCCEPFYDYASPRWLRDAGAVFHPFDTTPRSRKWTRELLGAEIPDRCFAPDYGDPVFLEKHARFLAAAARRYDGNPNVAFLDVGSFGTWGEGHTALSCGRRYPPEVKFAHLDLYRKAFPNTLLVAGDDFLKIDWTDHAPLVERALELGMALRDDSVLVDSLKRIAESEVMAKSFWPRKPVILEPAHYGQAKTWWNTWGDGSPYLESIERYHASYAGVHGWPREFLDENRDLIARINRRLGYRILPASVSWPTGALPGGPLPVNWSWRNDGVAPCLPGGHPALTLKDSRGGITAVLVDADFNVRSLPPGPPGRAESATLESAFTVPLLPPVAPGEHAVFISVGAPDGTPTIALPLADDDGQRRYRLGTLTITSLNPEPRTRPHPQALPA